MREYKFRGKRLDNGEWVYGWYLQTSAGEHRIANIDEKNFPQLYPVDPATVGQYTGLKDENGVEIYEGDILGIDIHSWLKTDDVLASANEVVEYRDCKYGVLWGFHRDFTSLDSFACTTFKIIGNIYENPELLKEAER